MKRFHYNIKQKLQILDLLHSNQSWRISKQFPNVTQKQIDEWLLKEDEMRMMTTEEQETTYILHSGPARNYEELYSYLYQVLKERRQDRLVVTVDDLVSIAEKEEPSIKNLTISGKRSLIRRFMKYYHLSIRRVTGYSASIESQRSVNETKLIEEFQREYCRLIRTHNIPPDSVFNMDQTAINIENLLARTVDFSGSKEIPIKTGGGEKSRVTLFSVIDAKGQLQPQMVVLKGTEKGRIKDEVMGYDEFYVRHTTQKNAWCDTNVLLEWLHYIWIPMVRDKEGSKLLILDSYPLHKNIEKSFSVYGVYVLYVPKGMTWALQPLDAGFFKLVKDQLQKEWGKDQSRVNGTEKEKRAMVCEQLKKVYDELFVRDHSNFWRKAGLEYPNNNASYMEINDLIEQEGMDESQMIIEE